MTFGGSLVRNARFGDKTRDFSRKSRGNLSLLVKVSWKMIVLEALLVTFGESLVENAPFGSFTRHFW